MKRIGNKEAMEGERERGKEFRTTVDGTVVKRVYTSADLGGWEPDTSLPGEYPFTRHISIYMSKAILV